LGVSGALLCAPYPVLLQKHALDPKPIVTALFSANLALAIGTGLVLGGLALLLGTGGEAALVFGGYGAVMLLRWFGRAHAYGRGQQRRVAGSDIAYGVTLVGGMLAIQLLDAASLLAAYWALLASALVGLLAFGRDYLVPQFARVSLRALPAYRTVWRDYAKWSLLGVVTTEGTANAHAYIVTLVGGPSAFAPIAASALLIRPIALAMNALTDFERPQLVRLLAGTGNAAALRGAVGFFRLALLLVWAGCLAAALAVLIWQPRLLFPEQYQLDIIWTGALLWLGIALIRTLRTPDSVLLQAGGEFRTLAFASVVSCGISIGIVAVMVAQGNLVFSLLGIALGEAVFAVGIWLRARAVLERQPAP
ncbi:MAG: hypothetical protein JWR39_1212, partial [Devosia sp.]|nr:hypothetical protein [Devosia sp.]